MGQCISYLLISQKPTTQKLVRLIKMYLHEIYSKIRVGELLSDTFRIQNGLKQEDALSPLLFNFALQNVIRKVQKKPSQFGSEWDTSAFGLC
jgi:hypothetical protein